jgi:hypothetical protein
MTRRGDLRPTSPARMIGRRWRTWSSGQPSMPASWTPASRSSSRGCMRRPSSALRAGLAIRDFAGPGVSRWCSGRLSPRVRSPGPEVVERYPYLAGGQPERLQRSSRAVTASRSCRPRARPSQHRRGNRAPRSRRLRRLRRTLRRGEERRARRGQIFRCLRSELRVRGGLERAHTHAPRAQGTDNRGAQTRTDGRQDG